MKNSKRILFTILNWGLGHATRSMPLINTLLENGIEVVLASDGRALQLLKKEYPRLRFLDLPPYDISYATENMFWNIGTQLPKIWRAIRKERQLIEQLVMTEKFDALISDNRFGCYHSSIPSVFMTHQVNIHLGNRALEYFVNKINQSFIQKFDTCWIPDFEHTPNLAGRLSHGHALHHANYLGALSRMQLGTRPKKHDLIVVLSGPEPQRTFLEEKIVQQLATLTYSALVVRGVTDIYEERAITPRVNVVSFLNAKELNEAILASEVVLCRSGYSSIMDLVQLQKQAILIPTPGQTEQEYLVEHLRASGLFVTQAQGDLNIEKAMQELKKLELKKTVNFPKSGYEEVVKDFIGGL